LGRPLVEELLEPTAIYVDPILALARAGLIRSAAHITGGGWGENVPRALPPGLGARVDTRAWSPQPIFDLIKRHAALEPLEMYAVFNMGMGMVAVVAKGREDQAMDLCRTLGVGAAVVGDVVEGSGVELT
jgi:phosphoribosylformylglycinamidine cyclo-ligase